MDSWNKSTHAKSGLIEKGAAPSHDDRGRGRAPALDVPARARAGERVADVRQLDLPGPALPRALDAARSRHWFHYRNLDVSTLKELVRRWKPELMKGIPKEGKHEALADILESIEELKFYRKSVMSI